MDEEIRERINDINFEIGIIEHTIESTEKFLKALTAQKADLEQRKIELMAKLGPKPKEPLYPGVNNSEEKE